LNLDLFCQLEGEGKERKKEKEVKGNKGRRRRTNAPRSLFLLFPLNLEGKENYGSRLPLTPFSCNQIREYTIYKVTSFVYSKQNILLIYIYIYIF
jgi:hypothetical protein